MGYRTTKSKIKVENNKTDGYTKFFYKAFRNILLVSLPFLIISALILSIPHSSADNGNTSTDVFTLTLDVSCTINGAILDPHTIHLEGSGLHREDIGTTKIGTYCNDNNGYNIYAVGSSGDIDGNTDLVADSSLGSSYNIKTGIYDDSAASLNSSSWSMKLTAGTGTGIDPITGDNIQTTPPTINNGYNNYNVIPGVYTLVASRPSGTNMNSNINPDVTGSYFTTTYDIYASSVQPAGTYEGKVKYVMVHPNNNNNTIPDLDTAFATAGKMKVYEEGGKSYYAMQDMDSQICNFVSNTGAGTATQLVDTRDNNLYWVAKLDDGKCWMTSNLDLNIGNTGPLSSNNTDISTDPGVYASTGIYSDYNVSGGVYTWNPVSTAITPNTTISGTTVSPAWPTDNNGNTKPYSAEGGDTYYYTSNSAYNDTRYNSLQACKASHTEAECKHYLVGNYYNWTAAIASNNSTNISTAGAIAANSICPKGWRLPNASQTNNQYNEFGRMLFKAGITAALSAGGESVGYKDGGLNKIRSNPYYFVRAGSIGGNTLYDPGVNTSYWSSTANDTSTYVLNFGSSFIYPARSVVRYGGRPVRCVTR